MQQALSLVEVEEDAGSEAGGGGGGGGSAFAFAPGVWLRLRGWQGWMSCWLALEVVAVLVACRLPGLQA